MSRCCEQMLRGAGYTSVASTMDPREVCELQRKNRYCLILLDLQMPGMDGFQVMEGLKDVEKDDYLPVLVITAQPGHKLRALQAGAKDFISKPFDAGRGADARAQHAGSAPAAPGIEEGQPSQGRVSRHGVARAPDALECHPGMGADAGVEAIAARSRGTRGRGHRAQRLGSGAPHRRSAGRVPHRRRNASAWRRSPSISPPWRRRRSRPSGRWRWPGTCSLRSRPISRPSKPSAATPAVSSR